MKFGIGPGILLVAACLTACSLLENEKTQEPDPHPVAGASDSAGSRFPVWKTESTIHAPGDPSSILSVPILWFSKAGLWICNQETGFTVCNAIIEGPPLPEALMAARIIKHRDDSLDRFVTMPNGLSPSLPGIEIKLQYHPSRESFPPTGWGEYRSKEMIRDSLGKLLLGGWNLVSASAGLHAPVVKQSRTPGDLGTFTFGPDSVFLIADSAGTKRESRALFSLDKDAKFGPSGNAIALPFLADLPLPVFGGRDTLSRASIPGEWRYTVDRDTLRISKSNQCSCGPRAGWVLISVDDLVFKKE